MRPRILTPEEASTLKNRIYISRTSKIFAIEDIALGWKIGKMTIYRYVSKEYRQKSIEDSKRQRTMAHSCYKCGIPWNEHERCGICTILTHGEPCCIGTPQTVNMQKT